LIVGDNAGDRVRGRGALGIAAGLVGGCRFRRLTGTAGVRPVAGRKAAGLLSIDGSAERRPVADVSKPIFFEWYAHGIVEILLLRIAQE